MSGLPPDALAIIELFAPLFTESVWQRARTLLIGAILVPGRRTVASVLRVMGLSEERRYKNYHRVLSRARWSGLAASRLLLNVLVSRFVPDGPIVLGIDDTIERRWGQKIRARGIYRDPVRSSRSHFVKVSGLRWLSVMLLVKVPWADRVWALPFLTPLCPSKRYYEGYGRAHRPLTQRAGQALRVVKRWLPTRQIVVTADNSFSALEFLASVSDEQLSVVTRLRLDAALYAPVPKRHAGQRGRPRKKGHRLATLAQVAKGKRTVWQRLRVALWYGESNREIEICSDTAVWFHSGMTPVAIRWVLIRDPQGQFPTQALLSTGLTADAGQIVHWFVQRWQLEVTFEEVRRHLGVETQRQWSKRAIARTTPTLMALFSLVTLLADRLINGQAMPVRTSAWYRKTRPTFSDALALVRRQLWAAQDLSMSLSGRDSAKKFDPVVARLADALCYAA